MRALRVHVECIVWNVIPGAFIALKLYIRLVFIKYVSLQSNGIGIRIRCERISEVFIVAVLRNEARVTLSQLFIIITWKCSRVIIMYKYRKMVLCFPSIFRNISMSDNRLINMSEYSFFFEVLVHIIWGAIYIYVVCMHSVSLFVDCKMFASFCKNALWLNAHIWYV